MSTSKTVGLMQLNKLPIKETVRCAIKEILREDPNAQLYLRGDQLLLLTGMLLSTMKRAS